MLLAIKITYIMRHTHTYSQLLLRQEIRFHIFYMRAAHYSITFTNYLFIFYFYKKLYFAHTLDIKTNYADITRVTSFHHFYSTKKMADTSIEHFTYLRTTSVLLIYATHPLLLLKFSKLSM